MLFMTSYHNVNKSVRQYIFDNFFRSIDIYLQIIISMISIFFETFRSNIMIIYKTSYFLLFHFFQLWNSSCIIPTHLLLCVSLMFVITINSFSIKCNYFDSLTFYFDNCLRFKFHLLRWCLIFADNMHMKFILSW